MTLPLARAVDRPTAITTLGLLAIAGYFGLFTYGIRRWEYGEWMLLWLAPVLIAAGVVIIAVVTRHDAQPLTRLLIVALVLKLAASFIRFYVSFSLYGSGDALLYDTIGADIGNSFHRGELTIVELFGLGQGTTFVEDLTGIVYTAMGPSRLGGYLVFSWIGFWGLFLFHRAARIGVPNADQRLYALLVCFLPSLLFWPSSIGKEALMMFSLGLCAYGAARVLQRLPWGWLALAGGLGLAYKVRPHVGVVVLAALIVAVAFRPRPGRAPVLGPLGRIVTVALLVLAMSFGLSRAIDRFLPYQQQDATGLEAVGAVLDRASTGTDEGGSEIDRPLPNSPVEYPKAAFTVLFRPTILEARSLSNVVAGAETTLLLVLFAVRWRRVRAAFTDAFRQPYLLFCIVYTAVFTFAWSAFSNLGALARQRVQVWPFLLVFLAAPLVADARTLVPMKRFARRGVVVRT